MGLTFDWGQVGDDREDTHTAEDFEVPADLGWLMCSGHLSVCGVPEELPPKDLRVQWEDLPLTSMEVEDGLVEAVLHALVASGVSAYSGGQPRVSLAADAEYAGMFNGDDDDEEPTDDRDEVFRAYGANVQLDMENRPNQLNVANSDYQSESEVWEAAKRSEYVGCQ